MRDDRIDLVLINPSCRARVYQALGETLTAVENPVWAGLIATFVRRRGFSVAIVDAEAEQLGPDETADRAIALRPRLVGIVVYGHQPSASTQNMTGASAAAAALKGRSPSTKVLIVGGHVAALPVRTLENEACDFTASDEGLHATAGLLDAYASSQTPDLRKVPGLVYRADGRVVSNAPAPLLLDFERELPGGAWDLLPMSHYRAHNWQCLDGRSRQPYAAIYTTLGCPYRCAFCCIQAPFKAGERALGLKPDVNSYRCWSAACVEAEIETLVERYGVRNIKFADEMFVLNPRHVDDICSRIIARGWDLNLWAYARVDTVKPRLLEKLKRAGFNWLALGIEAADPGVLTDSGKGYRVDLARDTVRAIQAAGINVIGNYIFGLPEDTLETMQRTLELAIDLNCEFANFYCAMAYPGSALYQRALESGWRLPESWSGYAQHAADTLPLPTRSVPAGDVLRFRDLAFERYFSSPRYLATIAAKFSDSAVAHIHRMTAHRLTRLHATA